MLLNWVDRARNFINFVFFIAEEISNDALIIRIVDNFTDHAGDRLEDVGSAVGVEWSLANCRVVDSEVVPYGVDSGFLIRELDDWVPFLKSGERVGTHVDFS